VLRKKPKAGSAIGNAIAGLNALERHSELDAKVRAPIHTLQHAQRNTHNIIDHYLCSDGGRHAGRLNSGQRFSPHWHAWSLLISQCSSRQRSGRRHAHARMHTQFILANTRQTTAPLANCQQRNHTRYQPHAMTFTFQNDAWYLQPPYCWCAPVAVRFGVLGLCHVLGICHVFSL
jgi:hypothetical protein